MAGTNSILPFSGGVGANILSDADYASNGHRVIGNQPGIASAQLNNKALRQATLMSSGLAQFIANRQGDNINDSLTPSQIEGYLAGVVAAGTTIAIIGDSVSMLNAAQRESWPRYLGQMLNEIGSPCRVLNFALSGGTFYQNNTLAAYGGQTPVQACIDAAPDIVLVMLGANDLLIKVDGRSTAQVIADATTMRNTLATALPNAKLIYISELCYDKLHFAPNTLLNKGVCPAFFTLRSTGILAGGYCADILTDALAAGSRTDFQNWVDFDTACKALAWNGLITYDHFKTARLGTCYPDGLHVNAVGLSFCAAQIIAQLAGIASVATKLPTLSKFVGPLTANSSALFGNLLTPSGDGYLETVTTEGEKFSFTYNPTRDFLPGEWHYPFKAKLTYAAGVTLSASQRSPIIFRCTGLPQSTLVYNSINGSAFGSIGLTSDDRGEILVVTDAGTIGVTAGMSVRYKIGNTITPVINVVVVA